MTAKTLVIISFTLVILLSGIGIAGADIVDRHGWTMARQPYIVFPTKTTYTSSPLTLNVSFFAEFYANLNFSMTYSLDGRNSEVLPLTGHYFGSPIINPANYDKNYLDGSVVLPQLSQGAHSLTVTLRADHQVSDMKSPNYPGLDNYTYFDSQTVNFNIDPNASNNPPTSNTVDAIPPKISNISPDNKTYTSTDVPLNFIVSENASRIVYSLDGNANVTIAGNVTLKGLATGAHNVTVYSWDETGNVGASDTTSFCISDIRSETPEMSESSTTASLDASNEPSTSLAPLIVASAVIVTVIVVGIIMAALVYWKRKR